MKAVVQKYINEHVPPATFDLKNTSKGARTARSSSSSSPTSSARTAPRPGRSSPTS
ncbi:MAG: hypothetical protein R3F43_28950 [bacterium]